MALSRKEQEEMQPIILETVTQRLGFPEKAVMKAALSCLAQKLDRDETTEQLSALLGQDLAPRFVEDLFTRVERYRKQAKSDAANKGGIREKRSVKDAFGDDGDAQNELNERRKKLKSSRLEALLNDDAPLPPTLPEPAEVITPVNAAQVSAIMADMKRRMQERKRQIDLQLQQGLGPPSGLIRKDQRPGVPDASQQHFMNEALEKARKAAALQEKIKEKLTKKPDLLASVNKASSNDKSAPGDITASQLTKPSAVLFDKGKVIDAATGRVIQFQQRMPTLKVNIREKKREQLKIEKPSEDIKESKHFDPRMSIKAPQKQRRTTFKFHEAGKFQQLGQRLRAKAQLERLQKQIQSVAKKTGISAAAKLAMVAPKKEFEENKIPSMEWWDMAVLPDRTYDDLENKMKHDDKLAGITNLVEHPVQKEPPGESTQSPAATIYLTKKERKKIRAQKRREQEKEKQEKIRLGLMPPPPPKVKISNLMRVLANEAVQDPTKVEAHVRAQMAARQKAHEAANEERKLTPEERKAKKIKKLKEDTTDGVHIAVYRLRDLTNPAKKFKVDMNAQQLYLTGTAVLFKNTNLVIVEGGPKSQKKFKRLMLHRIKWEEDIVSEDGKIGKARKEKEAVDSKHNKCSLVWEGTNVKKTFNDWSFKQCNSENLAREHLKKYSVEHYWDLALSQALIEETEV